MSTQVIDKIILGTVQFGMTYGINNTIGKPEQSTVNEILNLAYDSGIRHLDSAEAYGDAHDVIGKFHQTFPAKIFKIITKLPHLINGKLECKIEEYLGKLKVEKLEGLLFHSYESYLENKESLKKLNKYKELGKIKYLGVSVYTNLQLEDVINNLDIDIIQLPFNLFDNNTHRAKLLIEAQSKGKVIHTRSAFLQGLFFSPLDSKKEIVQKLMRELKKLHTLSEESNTSIQKMALNYCLQQPNINQVLIGVDNLNQLNENLSEADGSLDENLIRKIDAIHIRDVNLLNPSLWHQ